MGRAHGLISGPSWGGLGAGKVRLSLWQGRQDPQSGLVRGGQKDNLRAIPPGNSPPEDGVTKCPLQLLAMVLGKGLHDGEGFPLVSKK